MTDKVEVVDRRAIRDHHQNAALLGPGDQARVRPGQRLAVDVLLQQPLAHHQRERALGAAHRRVGLLVDDVAEIVQAAGAARLAGRQPLLARLPAFPGPRREAEDFDLDAAALERARQDIGAARRHHDRPAAHGAGVVEQQRHDGIAEIRIALALERERVHGVDDHAGETRGVERAFLEVEIPGAALLRQQAALQPVGKACDGARQRLQFLVEKRAAAGPARRARTASSASTSSSLVRVKTL